MLQIFRVGEQGVLDIVETIDEYIENEGQMLPAGVSVSKWFDRSVMLRSRMALLQRNAKIGLVLVFLCLTLFLDLRLAFWTAVGIGISFVGTLAVMYVLDASINQLTLFACP